MTTSDGQVPGIPAGLPDAATLGAWASEFFPEFAESLSAAAASAGAPADFTQEADPASYDTFGINEAIHEAIADSERLYRAEGEYAHGGFGFLSEARNIFGESGTAAAGQESRTLPSSAAQSVPLVATGISPNDAFSGNANPGFLSLVTPVETGIVPGFAGLGAFAPVIAPAESELSSHFFDVQAIRNDFPILSEKVDGKDLVWLDNAATTHKPRQVIDRIAYYYAHENSNVHRGAHALAARSTDAYEDARAKVARFLGAPSAENIIFVRGATEGINLVAQACVKRRLAKDDEIIVSALEHHANIVPWQQIAAETGARIRVIPVNDSGELLIDEYERLFSPRTKFVSVAHVSNALGTVTPVAELASIAHRHGVPILVDGAQSVSHIPVNVQALDVDFFVFSGHKVFGPTGIGAVYGKKHILEKMGPYQGGGNMIADVTFERTVYQAPPARFEAGTGNIADAVGLGAALDYVEKIGRTAINAYEHYLLEYGTGALKAIPGVRIIGTAKEKASVLSFTLEGFTTAQVGEALSREGIAVRSGHHCAQPILRRFGLESSVRPSLAFYNTTSELDALAAAVWNLKTGRISGPF